MPAGSSACAYWIHAICNPSPRPSKATRYIVPSCWTLPFRRMASSCWASPMTTVLSSGSSQARKWLPHATADKLQAVVAENRRRTASNGLLRIEFIDDQRLLAYGEGIVLEWNLETGQLLNRIQSRAPIEAAAVISGANDQVATISADGRYARWESSAGGTNFEPTNQLFLIDHGYARAVVSPERESWRSSLSLSSMAIPQRSNSSSSPTAYGLRSRRSLDVRWRWRGPAPEQRFAIAYGVAERHAHCDLRRQHAAIDRGHFLEDA